MAGQQPFNFNQTGFNLLPFLGNPLRNPQRLLSQLQGLRAPQSNIGQGSYGQESYGRQRMQNTDDHYRRELPDFDHRERSFRESYCRSQGRDNYANENHDRVHGLIDREIPVDFLFPEMSSGRNEEKYGRENLERQGYGMYNRGRSRSPVRSKVDLKDREFSPSDRKYGSRNDLAVPWNALLRRHCYLVPPLDDTYVLSLSEKQPGCRAIFIGGLPSVADEDIVREIFSVCGPIEQISLNSVRTSTQVKHCQVHFVKHDSVERAVKFNGYVLVIGDGHDRKTKIGRIRVDYDKLPRDSEEEASGIEVKKQQQSQDKKEQDLNLQFTRLQAFHLLDLIRHDQAITESLGTLTHWFEKGDCNRSTVNVFHALLNNVNSLIKRLVSRRKEHEQRLERQKQQAVERSNEIKQQYEAVCRVFEAATKQKAWDHFTKAQRKNITQWHSAIKIEIKSAKEAEIENRVEVGMDLDDEVPNLGGLIEQPALQTIGDKENQQDQEEDQTILSPSKAKKQRLETSESDADSADSLKLENEKLQTQVESLKAIAEQNSSLMWSMQSYQYQAEEIRQQYNNMMAAKDYEIFSLKKALQDANILTDPKRAMTELEIIVDLGKDSQNVTDMDLDTDELTENHKTGKESSKQGMQNQIGGMEEFPEKSTENGIGVDLADSSGTLQSDSLGTELVEVGNSEALCREGDPVQQVPVKEGDIGSPVERETIDTETEEKGIRGEVKDEKLEESKHADGKETEQAEEDAKKAEKADVSVEDGKSQEEDAEKQTGQEENEPEKMKEVEEDNEEEEGSGRFVEIDDEQFEVIDDMDEEDSDGDYKEITAAGSSLHVSEDNVQKAKNSEEAEDMNSDPANEQPASDSINDVKLDTSTQGQTRQNEDVYKEVNAQDQFTTNSSNDQPNYNSQYQAWLSAAVSSHASMDYRSSQVRISGEELVLIGIICSYLQLCPSGATSGEIRDYLSRQFKERRRNVVERLLCSLPVLFKAEDANGNAKWKFCGLEKLAEAKDES